MKDKTFSASIQKFVDANYSLGDTSKGWDCLNSLKEFYNSVGFQFPTEFRGYNEQNYAEKWRTQDCRPDLSAFLQTLGEKVDLAFMQSGDLLLFEGKEIPMFPGIFMGNGNVLMVIGKEHGLRVLPFKFLKAVLKEVRRLVK